MAGDNRLPQTYGLGDLTNIHGVFPQGMDNLQAGGITRRFAEFCLYIENRLSR